MTAAGPAVHEASIVLHSAARPPRTPGTIRVNATMALFEMQTTTVVEPTNLENRA